MFLFPFYLQGLCTILCPSLPVTLVDLSRVVRDNTYTCFTGYLTVHYFHSPFLYQTCQLCDPLPHCLGNIVSTCSGTYKSDQQGILGAFTLCRTETAAVTRCAPDVQQHLESKSLAQGMKYRILGGRHSATKHPGYVTEREGAVAEGKPPNSRHVLRLLRNPEAASWGIYHRAQQLLFQDAVGHPSSGDWDGAWLHCQSSGIPGGTLTVASYSVLEDCG